MSLEKLREFHINGDEKKFEEVVSELKFISKVQPNQKINVERKEIMSDSYQHRFYRTMLQKETRQLTLKYIKHVISRAIDIIYCFKAKDDEFYQELSTLVQENLIKAKKGIQNLALTYKDSDSLSSEFETILTSIEIKLKV